MLRKSTYRRQFSLKRVFVLVASLSVLFAVLGFWARPVPGRVPEATLLRQVGSVDPGHDLDELTRRFGFEPSAAWLDENQSGYVCWRFEVSDVPYDESRASYFAKLATGKLKSGFLLYPLESAGGGMRF